MSVEVLPHVQLQPNAEAAVEFAQASSFGNFQNHLPHALRRAAQAEIVAEIGKLATPEGIRLESARLIALASRPGAA